MKKLLFALSICLTSLAQAQDKFSNVKVLSITVNKFPSERLNGTSFDADGSPDLYAVFSAQNEEVYVTEYHEMCCQKATQFDLIRPFKVENLDIPYTLTLMDYDKVGDDEVVQKFTDKLIFAEYSNYPSEITLRYMDNAEVTLKLKWY